MTLDVFTDAMDDLSDTVGETATWTPASGAAAVPGVMVNIEQEVEGQPDGFGGAAWTAVTTLECRLADLTAEPVDGDTFTMGATVYTVGRVLERDAVWVKLAVKEA